VERKTLIPDDENYIQCDPKETGGQVFFSYTDKSKVPNDIQIRLKYKFPKKFLIRQAIDELVNVSRPYIKSGTINAEEYKTQCLQKRLFPFILKYHNIKDIFILAQFGGHSLSMGCPKVVQR
jgi:hypothetical protein